MVMTDFIYNDVRLSDLGYAIGYLETSASTTSGMGSELTFETYTNNATYKNKILRAKYETPITVTFDIVKSNCSGDENYNFSEEEISYIMTWLNQKDYQKFYPINDDGSYSNVYYWGTFSTIVAIVINDNIIGFTVTLETNSPFGYIDETQIVKDITEGNNTFVINNKSDEIGYVYPKRIVFVPKANGDFKINDCEIKNCKTNERLILDCENKLIESSDHSKLYNDFNYEFPRLINGVNEITVTYPSKIAIEYTIAKKVGIMV